MSLAATTYVLAQKFGSQSRKLVMIAIADAANQHGKNSWQSIDTIAHKAECSHRTVQRVIAELIKDGHLIIYPGKGMRGTNVYDLIFQKLPPGFDHPWQASEGCHRDTPTVQMTGDTVTGGVTMADRQTTQGGDNGGPSLTPKQVGTEENGGEQAPPPSFPSILSDPADRILWRKLAICFPDAPQAPDRHEIALLPELLPHLQGLTENDWIALLAWLLAPDRIRGRGKWPRDRRECLAHLFEVLQKIRPWWRQTGRKWWEAKHSPKPPAAPHEPSQPPATTLSTAEALALLNS